MNFTKTHYEPFAKRVARKHSRSIDLVLKKHILIYIYIYHYANEETSYVNNLVTYKLPSRNIQKDTEGLGDCSFAHRYPVIEEQPLHPCAVPESEVGSVVFSFFLLVFRFFDAF